jgi:hypothetical protein
MLLDSVAYAALSHPARALLVEAARQFCGDNNGRMLLSLAHLEPRGWRSAGVIQRAKKELLDAGFIHETVMGHRPNKASWYACCWMPLDKLEGYDPGAALLFKRSAYLQPPAIDAAATAARRAQTAAATAARKRQRGTPLRPSNGTRGVAIAPSNGIESAPPIPSNGAVSPLSAPPPIPSNGHHLETPSPRVSGVAAGALGIEAVSESGRPDALALAEPTVGSLIEQALRRARANR